MRTRPCLLGTRTTYGPCTQATRRHRRAELDEVKAGLQRHTVAVAMMFIFYSNVVLGRWRSDSMLKIDLERFRLLVADLRVVDARGRTCRSVNELDAVFVVRTLTASYRSCTP